MEASQGHIYSAFARWATASYLYAPWILLVALLTAVTCTIYISRNLGMNTDTTDMLAEHLPFRVNMKHYNKTFPQEMASLLLVLDAPTPEQAYAAAKFIEHFRKLSISTYAGWFKSYEGERFEFLEKKTMPRNHVLVRSQLIPANGDTVSFDYILGQGKEGWRIINVLADGVSDLALKRVEYRSILSKKGFPVLIDMLKKKIALAEKN